MATAKRAFEGKTQAGAMTPLGTPYDVTPDGQRVVVSTFREGIPTPRVPVMNWTAEIKK